MGKNKTDFSGVNNPNYKTGFATKAGRSSGFYNSWQNMKGRCLRESHPKYQQYGGRGIKICDEWLTITGFAQWALASGWKEGLSIDRIDNNGNYEPSNCWWISMSENSRKKSTTRISYAEAQKIRKRINHGEKSTDLALSLIHI